MLTVKKTKPEKACCRAAAHQASSNKDSSLAAKGIQAKLAIGKPNDKYEQEADRVADKVISMPESGRSSSHGISTGTPNVQKKCAACAHEEQVQKKPLVNSITHWVQRQPTEEQDLMPKRIQNKPSSKQNAPAASSVESRLNRSKNGGSPMSNDTRSYMENRIGADFSNVKVHTDSNAVQMSSELGAQAFTQGNHVYFNQGKYNPSSTQGKHLLAHELTHTVQQTGMVENPVQRKLIVDPNAVVPMEPGVTGPPVPLTMEAQRLINETCADGSFVVNQSSGEVTTTNPDFCREWHPPMADSAKTMDTSSTPTGCICLCNVISNPKTTTISFNAGGPFELPDSIRDSTNGRGSDTTVNVDPRFQGQYKINGNWVDVPFHLLFSHELCGHALESMKGTHALPGRTPVGGTPPDEVHAVGVERQMASEHGLPQRPFDYSGAARQKP